MLPFSHSQCLFFCCFHRISSLPHIFLTKEFPKVPWQACKAQTSGPWAAVFTWHPHCNSGLIISLGELHFVTSSPRGWSSLSRVIESWNGLEGTLKLILSHPLPGAGTPLSQAGRAFPFLVPGWCLARRNPLCRVHPNSNEKFPK